MADPVSWLLIEPGWRVEDATGKEAGRVLEVTGDSGADIFDGLVIASSALAAPRYVPAEQIAEITDGRLRLKLAERAIEHLDEYREPPAAEAIEPDNPSVAQRIDTTVSTPSTQTRNIPLLRRILLWFGLTGRR